MQPTGQYCVTLFLRICAKVPAGYLASTRVPTCLLKLSYFRKYSVLQEVIKMRDFHATLRGSPPPHDASDAPRLGRLKYSEGSWVPLAFWDAISDDVSRASLNSPRGNYFPSSAPRLRGGTRRDGKNEQEGGWEHSGKIGGARGYTTDAAARVEPPRVRNIAKFGFKKLLQKLLLTTEMALASTLRVVFALFRGFRGCHFRTYHR
jgi:hypothetical protein